MTGLEIPVPRRERQAHPWGFAGLTAKPITEPQVQWETLSQKNETVIKESGSNLEKHLAVTSSLYIYKSMYQEMGVLFSLEEESGGTKKEHWDLSSIKVFMEYSVKMPLLRLVCVGRGKKSCVQRRQTNPRRTQYMTYLQ